VWLLAKIGQLLIKIAEVLAAAAVVAFAVWLVISRTHQSRLTVQVRSLTVPEVASEVLAWADTLTTVTVQAWRPPSGDRVHLSMASTLSGPAGTVELAVFGGADHDPALVGALALGEYRSVTLGELRSWAMR
jgi:hypothetical protein